MTLANADIWRVGRYDSRPSLYEVRDRTAKTLTVFRTGWGSNRVLLSSIGSEWFWTEREAYESIAKSIIREIDGFERQIQQRRSELATVESKLRDMANGGA